MSSGSILIVEDESVIAAQLQQVLSRFGYSIVGKATSGEDAIAQAEALHPDLVLMDTRLIGKMDGAEAARQIHTNYDIPIVYLTAYADDARLQIAKDSEPYGYLVKPVQDRELYATIEMAFTKHQLVRKLQESEARYKTISELASDFAYSFQISADGSYSLDWITDAFSRITGYKPESLFLNDAWKSIVVPIDISVIIRHVDELVSGRKDSCEFRLTTPNGVLKWLHNSARPIWNTVQKRVVRIDGAASDITEQKLANDALHNSFSEAELYLRRLNTLRNIDLAINNQTDLRTLIDTILHQMIQLVEVDKVAVLLPDESEPYLAIVATAGNQENGELAYRELPIEDIYIGKAYRERSPVYIPELAKIPATHSPNVLSNHKYTSFGAIPLVAKDEAKGVLILYTSYPLEFNKNLTDFLQSLAMQTAIAIENADLVFKTQSANLELLAAYEATKKPKDILSG
jgi:PAS domain S-box-containing protein